MKYHNFFKPVLPLITIILFILASSQTIATPMYTITDIGTLGGGISKAQSINNLGQVVGCSTNSNGENHAFLWENDTITDLGTLGGSSSNAYSINGSGQIVGYSHTGRVQRAFLWENGIMNDLGTLGGLNSWAWSINDFGEIVGSSRTIGESSNHAFTWKNGIMTDLEISGGENSCAWSINNQGQIVGHFRSTVNHAFIWENGLVTDLGTLHGLEDSFAYSINNSGQIVGGFLNGSKYQAFIWENYSFTALSTIDEQDSEAYSINNSGQVVGRVYNKTGLNRAFLWENGVMNDLNYLIPAGSGWTLTYAKGINDAGQIVGYGNINGNERAFLLTPKTEPIPEPSTILLLTIGLGSVAAIGIRKKRKP